MLFLGDGFFNRFYTYFNLDNNTVSIAPNKEEITVDKIFKLKSEWDSEDWTLVIGEEEEKSGGDSFDDKPWYQKIFSGIFS